MGLGAAVIGGGALAAVGGVAGAVIGGNAAQTAAQTQAAAADQASQNVLNEFNETQANLSPFTQAGKGALTQLQQLTGTNPGGNPLTAALTAPFQPTQAQLAETPGFQFTLQQGQLATQDSFAAQGLGQSGAASKGAANFAEGLASTTFQQQFQNYLTQNAQIAGLLQNQVGTGENAAAMTGQQGLTATANAANLTTGGAAALAAGTVGQANAITAGIGGVGNAATTTGLALALNQGGLFTGVNNNPLNGAAPGLNPATGLPTTTLADAGLNLG
jgi:hypothetical protein